jgi:hypothetical protein
MSIEEVLEQGSYAQYATTQRAARTIKDYVDMGQIADAKRYIISEQKIASRMETGELKEEYTAFLKNARANLPETKEHPYFRKAWG